MKSDFYLYVDNSGIKDSTSWASAENNNPTWYTMPMSNFMHSQPAGQQSKNYSEQGQ